MVINQLDEQKPLMIKGQRSLSSRGIPTSYVGMTKHSEHIYYVKADIGHRYQIVSLNRIDFARNDSPLSHSAPQRQKDPVMSK
jgi:hypothetical protein